VSSPNSKLALADGPLATKVALNWTGLFEPTIAGFVSAIGSEGRATFTSTK